MVCYSSPIIALSSCGPACDAAWAAVPVVSEILCCELGLPVCTAGGRPGPSRLRSPETGERLRLLDSTSRHPESTVVRLCGAVLPRPC